MSVDYGQIITQLGEEITECDYRYDGMVPAYYQQQIREAIVALIKCRECQAGLDAPPEIGVPHDPYKVNQLLKMLSYETSKTEAHYGARLRHGGKDTNVLTIDAGGLRALIAYYATHGTDLENEEG